MATSLSVGLLHHWLVESGKIKIKPAVLSVRQHAATSLLLLCREHCSSVGMLLALGKGAHQSSALALLRPSFDALLRGGWVDRCLDDATYVPYRTGSYQDLPGKNTLLAGLKQVLPQSIFAVLEDHAEEIHKLYHDFTHGGHQQILRRFSSSGSTKGLATRDEERFVVSRVLMYDLIAVQWLANLVNDVEAREAFISLHRSLNVEAVFKADAA